MWNWGQGARSRYYHIIFTISIWTWGLGDGSGCPTEFELSLTCHSHSTWLPPPKQYKCSPPIGCRPASLLSDWRRAWSRGITWPVKENSLKSVVLRAWCKHCVSVRLPTLSADLQIGTTALHTPCTSNGNKTEEFTIQPSYTRYRSGSTAWGAYFLFFNPMPLLTEVLDLL